MKKEATIRNRSPRNRVGVKMTILGLVGCALSLFYLALLSLSEFLPFGWAYVTGAAACTGVITRYSATVLSSGKRATTILAALCTIYGMLYVMLRLQDFSLLLGTVGLFFALATVMYATRKIDWYAKEIIQ